MSRLTIPLLVLALGSPSWAAPAADAEALLRHGDVAGAVSAAEQAAKSRPGDLAAQELYYDLLVATGQGDRARKDVGTRAAADPQSADLQYLKGRLAADADASRQAYQAALALTPGHARATMGLGSLGEARGDWAPAAELYAAATKADPSLSEAWLGRIRCLVRQSKPDEALAVARKGLAAAPDEPALALVVAELEPKHALSVLQAAAKRIPDDPRLLEGLGRAQLAAGDHAAASKSAAAALALDRTSADGARLAALAREVRLGTLDVEGSTRLQEVVARGPLDPKGTIASLRSLSLTYPRSSLVRLALGSAKRAGGDAAGIDDLVEAARLDPTSADAAGAAGLALLEAERLGEAEPLLTRAAEARPWDPAPALGQVRILAVTGRTDQAHALAADLAQRFPRDPAVQVTQAGLLVDAGQADAAYQVLRRTLAVAPDPRVVAALVRVAPQAGHPEEAAALLEQIVEVTGNTSLAEAARRLRAQASPPSQ
ncbi:MAG: tetratricopeptide repeat protein [Myxococcota bacterium]